MNYSNIYYQFTDNQINKIKQIIESKQKTHCDSTQTFYTVWLQDNSGTEFRFCALADRLIISRVAFQKQRIGTLTAILETLIPICKSQQITYIIMQCVSSQSMVNFCNKYGFKPDPYATMQTDKLLIGDYVFTI